MLAAIAGRLYALAPYFAKRPRLRLANQRSAWREPLRANLWTPLGARKASCVPSGIYNNGLDDRVGAALFGRKVRFQTPRYDDATVAGGQQDMRGQVRQQQASGPSTLGQVISNIFSS